MDEHLDESSAMFYAALSREDAERRAAEAHVSQCERCRMVWDESLQLLTLLDGEAQLPAVSPALFQRVQGALQSPAWYARPRLWGWLGGALVSLALFWAQLDVPVHAAEPRSHSWVCARFEFGFAAAAFVLGVFYARIAARTLGPARASLVAMSGALFGQWVLQSRCDFEHTALHLLAVHVAGVAVSALLGAAAGAAELAARGKAA